MAKRPIPAGTALSEELIGFKRPGLGGLPPSALPLVVGKRLKNTLEEDEQILADNLE